LHQQYTQLGVFLPKKIEALAVSPLRLASLVLLDEYFKLALALEFKPNTALEEGEIHPYLENHQFMQQARELKAQLIETNTVHGQGATVQKIMMLTNRDGALNTATLSDSLTTLINDLREEMNAQVYQPLALIHPFERVEVIEGTPTIIQVLKDGLLAPPVLRSKPKKRASTNLTPAALRPPPRLKTKQ
jgi:hypothetical protein